MTTTRQVKQATRALLARHPELELIGHMIVLKPVRHALRAILLQRTLRADNFHPRYFACHTFDLFGWPRIDWGDFLVGPSLWCWSDPDIVAALENGIEHHALPILADVTDVASFGVFVARCQMKHKLFEWADRRIVFEVASGDLEAARETCKSKISKWTKPNFDRNEEDWAKLARLKELCRLLAADDVAGLAALLHDWEAQTVKAFGVEHLWEPSPFPLETKLQ